MDNIYIYRQYLFNDNIYEVWRFCISEASLVTERSFSHLAL